MYLFLLSFVYSKPQLKLTIKQKYCFLFFSYQIFFTVGSLFIDQTIPKDITEVEKSLSVEYGGTVEKGGWWNPTSCKPRVKV